jgi:hypothetical protein
MDDHQQRRTLSRVELDPSGQEISRIVAYEVTPVEVRLFDSTKRYGESLLVELVLAIGRAEAD